MSMEVSGTTRNGRGPRAAGIRAVARANSRRGGDSLKRKDSGGRTHGPPGRNGSRHQRVPLRRDHGLTINGASDECVTSLHAFATQPQSNLFYEQ